MVEDEKVDEQLNERDKEEIKSAPPTIIDKKDDDITQKDKSGSEAKAAPAFVTPKVGL